MTIKSKLTKKEYINPSYALLFRRPLFRVITIFGIILLFFAIMFAFMLPEAVKPSNFIYPIGMISFLPILTYFQALKTFNSNQRATEEIEYTFGEECLFLKGESFSSQFTFWKIYKVTQSNDWIFIWHNRQNANAISKQNLSTSDLNEIKSILEWHKVKNKL